ncbi:MAG TPA: hypothetical protein VIL44_04840 [Micromonospora sp.]
MTGIERGSQHDGDVLLRLVDSQLAVLRARYRGEELAAAERMATSLRELIAATAHASAADRARVRAAVHFFLRQGRGRRGEGARASQRMINDVARWLGRPDLAVGTTPGPDSTLLPAV